MSRISRIQTFFLEMAVVLLVFSAAAAIDLKLFAEGSRLSRQSEQKNGAVLTAQSIAEQIAAEENPVSAFTVRLNAEWNAVSEEEIPVYLAEVSVESEEAGKGVLCQYEIRITDAECAELYILQTSHYWQEVDSFEP
ncbi:MAG: hypothetical protein ACOX6P_01700 [Candidatus Merdivicinus sp.]|jgi:hypothetical protein